MGSDLPGQIIVSVEDKILLMDLKRPRRNGNRPATGRFIGA